MPLLIGLAGYAGSGKDTAADHLVNAHGFTKIAFADPLREEVAHVWRIPPGEHHMFTDRTLKELPSKQFALALCREGEFAEAIIGERMDQQGGALSYAEIYDILYTPRSPRWILQRWGTDYRRRLTADDYWTKQTARRIEQLLATGANIVVSDVRFDNEAELIRNNDGAIWRLWRQQAVPAGYSHASEQPIYDHLVSKAINNDASVGDLEEQIDALISFMTVRAEEAYPC